MKKIFTLLAICFVLTFTACSERPESNVENSGSHSEASGAAQKGTDLPQSSHPENSSEESDLTSKNDSTVNSEDNNSNGGGLSDKKETEPETDRGNSDTDDGTSKDSAENAPKPDTNNTGTSGVPDAENKTKQIIPANSDSLRVINKGSPFKLSLEITASGDVSASLTAERSRYAPVIQSDNQIGEAIDLNYYGGEIDEVILHFQIADKYVQNGLNLYPDVEELHGVKRFNIFKYFEDLNMLLPIETTVDTQTNTISSTVDELGTYCVIDMEKWFKTLEDFALMGG